MASSAWWGRGPECRTTGVPVPIISLASRLLLLSQWSRETGLGIVVARGAANKETSLGARIPGRADPPGEESWMPDEDSNLD
jgi:hypothetical protein